MPEQYPSDTMIEAMIQLANEVVGKPGWYERSDIELSVSYADPEVHVHKVRLGETVARGGSVREAFERWFQVARAQTEEVRISA